MRGSNTSALPTPDDLDTIERIVHDLKQDSAASKRKRHALSMAKGRTRQRETLAALRAQCAHLQNELQRTLDSRARTCDVAAERTYKLLQSPERPVIADPASPDSVSGGTTSDCSSINKDAAASEPPLSIAKRKLLYEYAASVETQNAIYAEIESLQKRIEQYEIFEAALTIDTSMLLAEPSSRTAEESLRRASPVTDALRGFWTPFVDGEAPIFFEPYDPLTAREMIRAMHSECKRFNALFSKRQVSASLENRCLGWDVQRSVTDKRLLRFHFTKRVPCASSASAAAEILNETWRTFHSPELYARLYRTVMVSRVIQRVDASTSVIMRNSPSKYRTHDVRMVTMVSKVQDWDERGRRAHHVLTLVVEPPPSALGLEGVTYFRNGYTYLTFTEIADDGEHGPMLEITYGGNGDCLSEAHATHLLIETGAVLVRWEQFVCPQRLVTAQ